MRTGAPAGAPVTRGAGSRPASAGLDPEPDVGLVADAPQPLLVGLASLLFLQLALGLHAQPVFAGILAATIENLDQVETELGLDGLAEFVEFEVLQGLLERR